MTYRERREAKAARLQEWAAKRQDRAAAVFKANEPFTTDIAFNTQPGHIPARARIIAQEDRAFQSIRKAEEMESRAAGIQAAADRAIYSDDPDAVEALEARIAALEAERIRAKYINIQIRKGPGWEARIDPPLTPAEKKDLIRVAQAWGKVGYPGYHFTNLSGNISRQKARLEQFETKFFVKGENQ